MANPTATANPRIINGLDELRTLTGTEVGVSDWMPVTQEMINRFADVTGDHQWIHVDVERARRETPFQSTIARIPHCISIERALETHHRSPRRLQDAHQLRLQQTAFRLARPRRRTHSRTVHTSASHGKRSHLAGDGGSGGTRKTGAGGRMAGKILLSSQAYVRCRCYLRRYIRRGRHPLR
jgi:hypothetical protein